MTVLSLGRDRSRWITAALLMVTLVPAGAAAQTATESSDARIARPLTAAIRDTVKTIPPIVKARPAVGGPRHQLPASYRPSGGSKAMRGSLIVAGVLAGMAAGVALGTAGDCSGEDGCLGGAVYGMLGGGAVGGYVMFRATR